MLIGKAVEQSEANGESLELIFNKYKLVEQLGKGGMAEVFRALSVGAAGFQRPVVIKRILPRFSSDPRFVQMFTKEASIAAALDHPNIVQVFDLGDFEGDLFMVLEYVPGIDLGSVLKMLSRTSQRIPPQLAAFIGVDLCKALECAHGHIGRDSKPQPVVHRDISPQNILLSTSGAVKLADFGLAMALGTKRMTKPGTVKGKAGYMSPEQACDSRDIDTRSDLFSLGVVLFETITGRRLFSSKTCYETVKNIRERQIPPLSKYIPDIPSVLEELVLALLERDRESRPESARFVRKQLASYLRSVHPPVDATTLTELVRICVKERNKKRKELERAFETIEPPLIEGDEDEVTVPFSRSKRAESRKIMFEKTIRNTPDEPEEEKPQDTSPVIATQVVIVDGSNEESSE